MKDNMAHPPKSESATTTKPTTVTQQPESTAPPKKEEPKATQTTPTSSTTQKPATTTVLISTQSKHFGVEEKVLAIASAFSSNILKCFIDNLSRQLLLQVLLNLQHLNLLPQLPQQRQLQRYLLLTLLSKKPSTSKTTTTPASTATQPQSSAPKPATAESKPATTTNAATTTVFN